MNVRAILLIFALACACLFGHAADDQDYEVNKWPVKASKRMPKEGDPAARAVAFLELIGKRDYETAKSFFSKNISAADRQSWDQFDAGFEKTHKGYVSLYSWHIDGVQNGMPMASLRFATRAGEKPTITFPMIKENGKWMVAGY